ncbi:hypothetical protein Tco_0300536 [Tanacetum coccineum]
MDLEFLRLCRGVEARTSTKDKGKEKVSEDASDVVETRRCTVENDSETVYESDDDTNRKAKAKAKDNQDLGMNEPNAENSMPTNNVRGETFEEHDIYMNELLKSLKTADKDGLTEDPFIFVEKHVERYPMYDETTHWRLRKPKVDEKYVSVVQFKECLTYYALENDFSLWYEKSREVGVVAKCEQRPPRLSDPEKEYEKTIGEHYSMLRSYEKAILDSNHGSTVKLGVTVNPDGKTYFDRFYVCFAGLADGWKAGCRKIIALDGCFLKSPNQGEILTAIGKDGNNHIYPVAWAVGLIEPVKDVMLNAEHRQCARHIYENFRKQYPSLEFKQLFCLFEVDRGCEAIDNGFSECFNSVSVNVRHKPLLTMLEAIRVLVLERMNKMREISRKWNPGVCPNIKKRLEWLKKQQRMWQLSGLPCVQAIKVIFLINRVPESYVPAWFETDMYFVAYHNYVNQSLVVVSNSKYTYNKSSCNEPVVEQTPKPKGVPGRPRKNQSVDDLDDVDVVLRGQVRDEMASGSRGGATGSRGRGGATMSRGDASGSRGGASVLRGVVGGSRGGFSVSGGASGSRDRGAGVSGGASGSRGRGAGGSKMKHVSTAGTQKR